MGSSSREKNSLSWESGVQFNTIQISLLVLINLFFVCYVINSIQILLQKTSIKTEPFGSRKDIRILMISKLVMTVLVHKGWNLIRYYFFLHKQGSIKNHVLSVLVYQHFDPVFFVFLSVGLIISKLKLKARQLMEIVMTCYVITVFENKSWNLLLNLTVLQI